MGIPTFKELYKQLREGDETVAIEAKRGSKIDAAVQETVSAFCNAPDVGGGYLLLGVTAKDDALFPDYEVVGVKNPEQLQSDLATQCREVFNVPVRPTIQAEQHNEKNVIVAFIPEAQTHEKPVYIKRRGIQKGAYIRVGPTDQRCTDDDLAVFFQARGHRSYDATAVQDTSVADVDPAAMTEFKRLLADNNPESELLGYPDEDILDAVHATTRGGDATNLTVAGLVLFGKPTALRRFMPMVRVDYIRVEGREWVPDPDKRYQTVEKLGPLLLVIPQIVSQVLDDIPKAFTLEENSVHRKDVPLIPRKVIREAVVNALMHRSYHTHQAVQIVRYANRIEIINPGYSLVPDDRLGAPGSSRTRNPNIASVLHDVGLAETKGTGIRAMREAMQQANLTHPLFESDRQGDAFTVRLLTHHLLGEEDWKWLAHFKDCNLTDDEARALILVREIGSIDNAVYRWVNHVDSLSASGHLKKLRRSGLLEQKGAAAATYYVPTQRFLDATRTRGSASPSQSETNRVNPSGSPLPTGLNPVDKPLPTGLNPVDKAKAMGLGTLPTELAGAIESTGKRSSPARTKETICKLCSWRPLQASQIAGLLGRSQRYLLTTYLRPMVRDGELEYVYPDAPAHPKQAYRTVVREGDDG